LKPHQRPAPPILLAAFTSMGLRRVARRVVGWLPVAMPLPYLTVMWATILKEAEEAGRDPSVLRMALRVNPELTAEKAEPEQIPATGTLEQYIDYARSAAEAGVHELFIDFGQSRLTLEERTEMAGRFIEGVRAG
jgi:alkanesulfonate monooxygenase SsuD/methylene tetrahydromethanopterin reductase-like flavin-dependent oxidoreductase (luciferase family)